MIGRIDNREKHGISREEYHYGKRYDKTERVSRKLSAVG